MDKKLQFTITIDVEDKTSGTAQLIEGDFGEQGYCGVNYIMDVLERHHMRGVFFVNIYEHAEHEDGYMESLVKRIAERGHEVGLHTHASDKLPFFNQAFTSYPLAGQETILEYGYRFLQNITGKRPISYRSGGYECNDDTFTVLQKLGFLYDSSYFYNNSNNKFTQYQSLNQVCKVGGLTEFPVVSVYDKNGRYRKLDPNFLTYDEIIGVVEQMKVRPHFTATQMMFHSFSFIDQTGKPGQTPLFERMRRKGFGLNKPLMNDFDRLLTYLEQDPAIDVVTFEEYDALNLPLPASQGDGLFYFDDPRSASRGKDFVFDPNAPSRWYSKNDLLLTAQDHTLYCANLFSRHENYTFAYEFVCPGKEGKVMYRQPYSNYPNLVYSFDPKGSQDGTYLVKAFINGPTGRKSVIGAEIEVKDGLITFLQENHLGASSLADIPACSVCGAGFGKMKKHKGIGAPNRQCSVCNSLERQRTFKTLCDTVLIKTIDFSKSRILHISPSKPERRMFAELGVRDIKTMDIRPEVRVDIVADVCNMENIEDGSFDIVFASYLLECVYDEKLAIREIARVLRPGGYFLLSTGKAPSSGHTVTAKDIEQITRNYGKEAYEKSRVGSFRQFGIHDMAALLEDCFSVDTYLMVDLPTQELCAFYAAQKPTES